MPLRYLDKGATIQMRRPVVLKMISDRFDDYGIEVLPGNDVELVMYKVQRKWGVGPSKQRLFIDGRPLSQDANLESLGEGAQILVAKKKQGGSGKKALARRAARERLRKLTYKETERIMAARSGRNKDMLLCEYEQEMEERINVNNRAGIVAEGAYAKKLEKKEGQAPWHAPNQRQEGRQHPSYVAEREWDQHVKTIQSQGQLT